MYSCENVIKDINTPDVTFFNFRKISFKGVLENEGLDEELVKFSSSDDVTPMASPAPSDAQEQEKMDICEDLDDISESEILPSDKESESEMLPSDKESEEEKMSPKEKESFNKLVVKDAIIDPALESVKDSLKSVEPVVESLDPVVKSDLSQRKDVGEVSEPSLLKLDAVADVRVENQVERTKEASEALLELASCFADFGRAIVVPVAEGKHDISSESVNIPKERADKKIKNESFITEEFDSEATMSADEVREFKDLCSDEELINRRDSFEGIASQLIAEHSYCLPRSVRTEKPARVPTSSKQNLVIKTEPAVHEPKQIGADHEYTRVHEASPPFVIPPSPPKVMPRRKTKLKRRRRTSRTSVFKDTFSEIVKEIPSVSEPQYKFEKRSVIDELNILYEFLRSGVDYEDTMYLQKGYDIMLQEDIQGAWLNSTHWVDHPHILSLCVVVFC